MHFSRVCCSARMHEDDARWPTVHTTGALSDVTPPDFVSRIWWLTDRKTGNAAKAIRCLLVSFLPGMLAFVPQPHPQLLPTAQAEVSAVHNAANRALDLPAR